MNANTLDRTTGQAATLGGLHDEAGKVDEALLPCRPSSPRTSSSPRPCARRARSGRSASTEHSTGASPGACGAVSCSFREW